MVNTILDGDTTTFSLFGLMHCASSIKGGF